MEPLLDEFNHWEDQQSYPKDQLGSINDLDELQPKKDQAESPQRKKKIKLTISKVDQIIASFREYEKLKLSKQMTLATIGQKHEISHTLLYKLWGQFQKDSTLKQTRDFIMNIKKPPGRGLSKSTLQLQDWIKGLIDKNPFLTTHQIAQIMNKKYEGRSIHEQTVLRILKLSGYSYKSICRVPLHRNTPDNIEKRYKYALKYQQIRLFQIPFYFIDIINFNAHLRQTHGWSLNGEPITFPKVQYKDPNLSLLCVLGVDGLACWHVSAGKYSKKTFMEALNMLIRSFLGKIKSKRKMLIYSNESTKQRVAIRSISEQFSFQVLQLPPHSSLLNPIEAWFYELKAKMKKNNFKCQQGLTESLTQILKTYQQHDFKSYFKNVDWYIKNSLEKQIL